MYNLFPLFVATSLAKELVFHIMVYNSVNIISKRYADAEIYYKLASFDMNSLMDSSHTNMDEESVGFGDEYPVEIAVMNEMEYKFHPQEQYGRTIKKNEFIKFRARMPLTEHIVNFQDGCGRFNFYDFV